MNYRTGKRENYYWFESDSNDFDFGELLRYFPEFLLKTYVVINAFDSGRITWSAEEIEKGYSYLNGVAVTSRIENVQDLPFAGYDEWYVLKEPQEIDIKEAFVNNYIFLLREDADQYILSEVQTHFWRQLMYNLFDKFLSQNGKFIFVT